MPTWTLVRPHRPGEPPGRLKQIATPVEVVRPHRHDDVWHAEVHSAIAYKVLVSPEWGFSEALPPEKEEKDEVEREVTPAAPPIPPAPPAPQATPAIKESEPPEHALEAKNEPAPVDAIVAQAPAPPPEPEQRKPQPPPQAPQPVPRRPVPAVVEIDPSDALSSPWAAHQKALIASDPLGDLPPMVAPLLALRTAIPPDLRLPPLAPPPDAPLIVVLTVCGWTDLESAAATRAAAACHAWGSGARLVIANNGPAPVKPWKAPKGMSKRVLTWAGPNQGFADANQHGLEVAGDLDPAGWLLWTQADVTWGLEALAQAVALAQAAESSLGVPVLVGPSGGFLQPEKGAWKVSEWGRNIGQTPPTPRAVDFLAGYWVLGRVGSFAVPAWDSGFFLYWEDPDLAWRAYMAHGTRPIAAPALLIDHDRGHTIKRVTTSGPREIIRTASAARFAARWRGPVV